MVQDEHWPRAQFARGKYAQHLCVVPESGLVLVRIGRDSGYPHQPQLLGELAGRLAEPASGKRS